jgi:hypothetical protein
VATGALVAAAGIGAGTTLYGGAKSFSDASKARRRGQAAERAADNAIEEARRRVDVNAYEQLSIAKEPYELMRDALLTAGRHRAMQAGVKRARPVAPQLQRGAYKWRRTYSRVKSVPSRPSRWTSSTSSWLTRTSGGSSSLRVSPWKRRRELRLAVRDAEEDRANYIAQGVGTLGGIAEGLSSSYAAGDFGRIKARGLAAESENVGELLAGLDAFGMPTAREQRQANRRAQENNMVDFPQPLSRSQQNQLERQGRRDLNDIQRAQAQAAIDPAFGGPVIAQDRTFNPNFSPLGTSARPDQYTAPGQAMSPRQTERMLMAQRRLGQQEARDIQRAIRRNPEYPSVSGRRTSDIRTPRPVRPVWWWGFYPAFPR